MEIFCSKNALLARFFLCRYENRRRQYPFGGKEALACSGEQGGDFAGKFHPEGEYYN